MANNMTANEPKFYVSKVAGTPASHGFTSVNTAKIYKSTGTAWNSWDPTASINSLTNLAINDIYLIYPLTTRDAEDKLVVQGTTGLSSPGGQTQLAAPAISFDTITDTGMRMVIAGAVTNATSYLKEISTSPSFGTIAATATNNSLNQSFTGLTPGVRYYGRAQAIASGYTSSNFGTNSSETTGGGSAEAEVTDAYADLAAATSPERTLLQDFTSTLVSNDIYDDIIAFWPFVGSDFSHKIYNLVDPANTDEAFRLSVVAGTPVSDTKGIALDEATSDELITHLDLSGIGYIPNIGVGSYHPTHITGTILSSVAGVAGTRDSKVAIIYDGGDDLIYPTFGNNVEVTHAIDDTLHKHWLIQRNADDIEVWNDGVLRFTQAQTFVGFNAGNFLGFLSRTGVEVWSCLYVVRYLDSTKAAIWNTAVETLMAGLGRDS